MRCYKCGCVLSANDTCAKCGTDVSIYKKTARVSDIYYNKGLEKARVRDLSGAIETLKVSLMINKYNINARNLLGLIYCEMGEVVEALSQWVMSKNLAPDDNVAESYIKKIQSNQNKFESVTNAIKKYNVSLQYAKDKNTDMAVIQLKKIVISNPHFIKAHLLLALIYIKDNEYQRARKLLNSVLKIDRNNTLASKYLEQINQSQNIKDNDISGSFLPKKKVKEEESKPLNGNDVILPRSSYKEPSNGAITIVNVLVGVVIGAALIWFLVMPSRYKGITEDYNRSLAGKCYGKKKVMNNLSLSLESGRIVGILGPNGSGKSTLIKMMAGVLKPTSGQIIINGYPVGVNTKKIVSYLPERTYLNPSMKVKEAVDYFADFYEDFSKQKALDMLEKFGINEQDKIKSLSKGTREKVQIVLVMSREAKLYLLDEPMGGVDPAARDYILRTIISNYNEDATVVITTHLISDIENVLDEVVFIKQGEVYLKESVDDIRTKYNKSVDALFREVFVCY